MSKKVTNLLKVIIFHPDINLFIDSQKSRGKVLLRRQLMEMLPQFAKRLSFHIQISNVSIDRQKSRGNVLLTRQLMEILSSAVTPISWSTSWLWQMGASERKVHRALLQDCSAHSLSCTKMVQLHRISTDLRQFFLFYYICSWIPKMVKNRLNYTVPWFFDPRFISLH